jgi:hypothetical protein
MAHIRAKYLTDTIDFNKHGINIFINDTWRKYEGVIGQLFKNTRQLELRFWPTRKRKMYTYKYVLLCNNFFFIKEWSRNSLPFQSKWSWVHPWFYIGLCVVQSLVVYIVFSVPLFVWSFCFLLFYYLYFILWLLITPMVSSHFETSFYLFYFYLTFLSLILFWL